MKEKQLHTEAATVNMQLKMQAIELENLRKLLAEKEKVFIENENYYNSIFENLQEVFLKIDLLGIIVNSSSSIEHLTDFSKTEVLGKKLCQLCDDTDQCGRFLDAVQTNNELRDYNFKLKTKKGIIKFVAINARLIAGQHDKQDFIYASLRDLTEEIQIVNDLEESREKYRGLSEAAFESIFISEKGLCIEQNKTAEKIFGYTSEEAIGRYGTDWIAAEDRAMVMNKMLTGFEEPYEANALKKDGTLFPCLLQGKMMHYKGKNIRVTSLTDISTLKKAEKELINSKEKYQKDLIFLNSIFESPIDIIIFSLDKNYCYTKFTKFHKEIIKKIWGVDIQIGMNMLDVITNPNDRQKAKSNFDKALSGAYFVLTEEYGDTNLYRAFYENYYSSILNAEGEIVGVSVFVIDVTERKKSEEQLQLLSRAVDQSPVIVMITDKAGNIEYVNPKFTEITAYTLEEVKSKSPRFLQSGNNSKAFYKELWDTILSGKDWKGEFYNKKKNGDLYCQRAVISSILNTQGEISFFIAVLEDVTEKKMLIEDLILAKEKAEESNRLKTAFLNNISHEIRTPFNGLLGFLSMIQEDKLSLEARSRYIDIINASAHRLINTINDILEISQIQSGQLNLTLSACNIKKLFEELYIRYIADAETKGLQLNLINGFSDESLQIETDKTKLYAVLFILIGNAIKFTKNGSVEFGYVTKPQPIQSEKLANQNAVIHEIEFYIKDTGIGIPENKQQLIFERFMQADVSNTRHYEGSGLGLSIAKAYAEMLGAKISLESEVGKGSCFYVTIGNQ